MDEDFHIILNKKQQHLYKEQFSASDTESSEHEAAGKVSQMLTFLRF